MTAVLPIRVQGQAGEPADSLLHRLASRWGMPTGEFQQLIGLKEVDRRRGSHASLLAALLGLDEVEVARATPHLMTRRRVSIGKAWTDVRDVAAASLRYCPYCFREGLHHWSRTEWAIKSVASCTLHNCLLLDRCFICGESPGLHNPSVGQCRCGSELAQGEAPSFTSEVDSLLLELISTGCSTLVSAEVGLLQISSFLTRLGAIERGWSEQRPESADGLLFREQGLRVARAPEQITRLLDKVLAESPLGRSGKRGLTSSYGWIWTSWLCVAPANLLDAEGRLTLLRHAESYGIQTTRNVGVTLETSRAILGAGHDRTRRLLKRYGQLKGNEVHGKPMQIDPEVLESIRADMRGLLTGLETAKFLGVGGVQLAALVEAGLIKTTTDGCFLDGVRYHRANLELLLKQLEPAGSAEEISDEWVQISKACQLSKVLLSQAVAAVKDGKLSSVRNCNLNGLLGIFVKMTEIRTLRSPRQDTIGFVAEALGVQREAASWLVRNGLLKGLQGRIDAKRMKDFRLRYATSAQAALQLGFHPKGVVRALSSMGLKPAFGRPECRQLLWRRSDLRRLSKLQ